MPLPAESLCESAESRVAQEEVETRSAGWASRLAKPEPPCASESR